MVGLFGPVAESLFSDVSLKPDKRSLFRGITRISLMDYQVDVYGPTVRYGAETTSSQIAGPPIGGICIDTTGGPPILSTPIHILEG